MRLTESWRGTSSGRLLPFSTDTSLPNRQWISTWGREAIKKLVQRGTLVREAFGVYRFPKYPVSEADPYMLAVLWTRVPEAALSHETALAVYDLSDVNPN